MKRKIRLKPVAQPAVVLAVDLGQGDSSVMAEVSAEEIARANVSRSPVGVPAYVSFASAPDVRVAIPSQGEAAPERVAMSSWDDMAEIVRNSAAMSREFQAPERQRVPQRYASGGVLDEGSPRRLTATEALDNMTRAAAGMGVSASSVARGLQGMSRAFQTTRSHTFTLRIDTYMEYRTMAMVIRFIVLVGGPDGGQYSAEVNIPEHLLQRASARGVRALNLEGDAADRVEVAVHDLARYVGFWGIREAVRQYVPDGAQVTAEAARLARAIAERELDR